MKNISEIYSHLKIKLKKKNREIIPDITNDISEDELIKKENIIYSKIIEEDRYRSYAVFKIKNDICKFPNKIYESIAYNLIKHDKKHAISFESECIISILFWTEKQDKEIKYNIDGTAKLDPFILNSKVEIKDVSGILWLVISFPRYSKYLYNEYFYNYEIDIILEVLSKEYNFIFEEINLKDIYQKVQKSEELTQKGFKVHNLKGSGTPAHLGFMVNGSFTELEKSNNALETIVKEILLENDKKELNTSNKYSSSDKELILDFLENRNVFSSKILNRLHEHFENGRGFVIAPFNGDHDKNIRYTLFYDVKLIKCSRQNWVQFSPLWGIICRKQENSQN